MIQPTELVCYSPNPKAHLCPLDRAVLRILGDPSGRPHGSLTQTVSIRLLLASEPSLHTVVGSLRRLERLDYVQRVAGAWRLAQ